MISIVSCLIIVIIFCIIFGFNMRLGLLIIVESFFSFVDESLMIVV